MNARAFADKLDELLCQLNELLDDIEHAEVTAVQAREDYTQAYSKAFLEAEGAMDARRHQASLKTTAARLNAELAETTVKGLRRQIDSVRLKVDCHRSVGSAMRSELQALQGGSP